MVRFRKPEVIRLEGDAFTHAATGFNPPPGDDYCLEVQTSDNTPLAHYCFDLGFTDVETGLPTIEPSPFFFTLTDVDPLAAAKITLSKNEAPLATLTPSNHAPVSPSSPPTAAKPWPSSKPSSGKPATPMATLCFTMFSIAQTIGQSWLPLVVRLQETSYTVDTRQLPTSHDGLIRVVASDGFHSSLISRMPPSRLPRLSPTASVCWGQQPSSLAKPLKLP